MADFASAYEERYAQVSSLYGPGTMAAWYFGLLSLLLVWTLHPEKRRSGSVDADLIAVLTIPAVAAGHSLVQLYRFAQVSHTYIYLSNDNFPAWSQTVASIDASLNVVETFFALSGVLHVIALTTLCFRRAFLIGAVEVLCGAVEIYLWTQKWQSGALRYDRDKLVPALTCEMKGSSREDAMKADASTFMITVPLICAISLGSSLWTYTATEGEKRATGGTGQDTEMVVLQTSDPDRRTESSNPLIRARRNAEWWITTRSRFTLEISRKRIIATVIGAVVVFGFAFYAALVLCLAGMIGPEAWGMLKQGSSQVKQNLMPRTPSSISDLDQIVAAAGGFAVLVFRVYGVIKARRREKKRNRVRRRLGSEIAADEVEDVQ